MDRHELIQVVKKCSAPIAENFGLSLGFQEQYGTSDVDAAVTRIDRIIQHSLMEQLSGDFMGEESGERNTGSEYTWYCDPMDGTGVRIRSIPVSLCIATLMRRTNTIGFPVMTVLHNPVSDQTWSAELDRGAWYSFRKQPETRLMLDAQAKLPRRILSTLSYWPGEDWNFETIRERVFSDRRFDEQSVGSLGFAHAIVSSGTSHLSVCRGSAAYETAAATLLMIETGGVACNLHGQPFTQDGFPLGEVRGKTTFTVLDGAIIASSHAVADTFLEIVHSCN